MKITRGEHTLSVTFESHGQEDYTIEEKLFRKSCELNLHFTHYKLTNFQNKVVIIFSGEDYKLEQVLDYLKKYEN